ncbi:MAG: DUF1648 domain-containing protein [Clostridia bacterium]|nr:DUF1648 domain-containing protein [Clostridia bacterium]
MKFMKWKIFFITAIVCLLPILLGLALWESLPESIPIHFDIAGNPDNYAAKGVVVFLIPVLMVLAQFFCCFINDINAKAHGERKKFSLVTKWILPIMSIVLQTITYGYALGWNIDIRRVVAFLVGGIFIVMGNYLPKFDYIKNYDVEAEKARKINRFIGYMSFVMGLLFIISIFLPPIFTLCCIILLIPYAIIGLIYGIKEGRKK